MKKKEIIQSFLWNYHLNNIDQNNPYEISKFEKEIKKLSYSIKDETLKKYVLEDFLEKIRGLTPIQSSRQNNFYSPFKNKKNLKVLKETKILHQKRKDLSKIQIIEFSILYIILNYSEISTKKIDDLNEIKFISDKNENLKNFLIDALSQGIKDEAKRLKINEEYGKIVKEVDENSNIQMIIKNKTDKEILSLLDELIQDYKDQNNLKKIESLERKLINNLDENSYSELMKLKTQLNRD